MPYDKPKVTIDLDEYLELKSLIKTPQEQANFIIDRIEYIVNQYNKTTTFDPVTPGFVSFLRKQKIDP
jgi:hypothetical protein